MIAILENWSLQDEVLSTSMVSVEQTLSARTLTLKSDNPEDLTALTPNHFQIWRKNASALFMPYTKWFHDLRKTFKRAQAYADMIFGKKDSWISSRMESEIKVDKRCAITKRTCLDGRLFTETHVYMMRRVIQVFKGDNGVVQRARVKTAHGELNKQVVKLAAVSYDNVTEIGNIAGDVGANIEKKHEPSDQPKWNQTSNLKFCQNSKMDKI